LSSRRLVGAEYSQRIITEKQIINKDVVKTYVPFNIKYVSRIQMPVSSILAYTQSLAAVRKRVVSHMYRSEQSQGEKAKTRMIRKRVEAYKNSNPKMQQRPAPLRKNARTEEKNIGVETTQNKDALWRWKKAEKQRVMALFALPKE
jgi:predicted nucleotidyltransferase